MRVDKNQRLEESGGVPEEIFHLMASTAPGAEK